MYIYLMRKLTKCLLFSFSASFLPSLQCECQQKCVCSTGEHASHNFERNAVRDATTAARRLCNAHSGAIPAMGMYSIRKWDENVHLDAIVYASLAVPLWSPMDSHSSVMQEDGAQENCLHKSATGVVVVVVSRNSGNFKFNFFGCSLRSTCISSAAFRKMI